MRCSCLRVMNVVMALAAVASCAIWVTAQQENSMLGGILRGHRIRTEDSAWMQEWLHKLRTTDVAHKTVVLTGASRGLGRGIAAHLLGAGARVVLPLRDVPTDIPAFRAQLEKEARDLGYNVPKVSESTSSSPVFAQHNVVVLPMDLSDLASITRFVWILKGLLTVDVLINNAGLISLSHATTVQGYEMTMGVNFFGTAHLTLLLDETGVLAKDAVIVSVGSEEHRNAPPLPFNPPTPPSAPFGKGNFSVIDVMNAYGQSKLALAAWSYELARRWEGSRVVRCICPGPVVSDIARSAPWPLPEIVALGMRKFFIPATEAALPVLWLALAPEAQKEREINWHMSRPAPASQNVSNPDVGKWIWNELAQSRAT